MKKIYLIILTMFVCALSIQAQETYKRMQVSIPTPESVETLRSLGVDISHSIIKRGQYIESNFSPWEQEQIKSAGLEYKVLFKDMGEYHTQKRQNNLFKSGGVQIRACSDAETKYKTPENFALGTYGGFFTYEELLVHLDNMHNSFPNLISPRSPISDFLTHEDRPIFYNIITSDVGENKRQLLFTAIHHAREPMSMTQMVFFMYYLLENYDNDPVVQSLLDTYELHFVPCVNPDGYLYNESEFVYNPNTGYTLFYDWRKNKRDNNGDGVFEPGIDGVDLNRNYGFNWGLDDNGSSPEPSSLVYRGPEAFSEPETQALKWLCESNEYLAALNYHSYGNLLIYPWGFVTQHTTDQDHFCSLAEAMTSENQYLSGLGGEIIYNTNGDADDWMYGEQIFKNKILSMTPEVGHNNDGFYPVPDHIIPLCKLTLAHNLYLIKGMGSLGFCTDWSEKEITETTGSLNLEVQQHGLNQGSFEVKVTSLSELLTFGTSTFPTEVLANTESVNITVPYEITGDINYGEEIGMVVSVDNGAYVEYDTLYKLVKILEPLFSENTTDDFNDASTFDSEHWGLTTERFVSPPSCLTDSPNGNYSNYSNDKAVVLVDTIDLTTATYGEVNFWASWDIEENFDYAQIWAKDVNSETYTSLCGLYTNINGSAGPGEPVYDGTQLDWVKETIFLNDFLGEKIQLTLVLGSDQGYTADGFYIDDLNVLLGEATVDTMAMDTTAMDTMNMDTIPTSLEFLETELEQLAGPIPNPARDLVTIEYKSETAQELVVTDEAGRIIFQSKLKATEGQLNFNVSDWNVGIYFCYLKGKKYQSNIQKLVVH